MSTERDKKEDKAMSAVSKTRGAHDVLDGLSAGRILSKENEQLLRSFLPDLPKQKTLEEIIAHVYNAWTRTNYNEWTGNTYNPDILLEEWLVELHVQLQGLKDAPAVVPELPAGMRIADHEEHGRVVVAPKPNDIGQYKIFHLDDSYVSGADVSYVEADALTFIDAEPAKPAHPEFLETEADYAEAPNGTIVVKVDALPWVKEDNGWTCAGASKGDYGMSLAGSRRVLRWGWGE